MDRLCMQPAASMRSLVEEVVEISAFVREKARESPQNTELIETLHEVHEKLADLQLSMLASPITGRMFVPSPAPESNLVYDSLVAQLEL